MVVRSLRRPNGHRVGDVAAGVADVASRDEIAASAAGGLGGRRVEQPTTVVLAGPQVLHQGLHSVQDGRRRLEGGTEFLPLVLAPIPSLSPFAEPLPDHQPTRGDLETATVLRMLAGGSGREAARQVLERLIAELRCDGAGYRDLLEGLRGVAGACRRRRRAVISR